MPLNDSMALEEETSIINLEDSTQISQKPCAKFPFNNPDKADAVVQTSDNIQFHVYEVILSFVSSYFEDLFNSTPKQGQKLGRHDPEDVENASFITTRKPVHRITEDSEVFDSVLRSIYPGLTPPTLTKIEKVLPLIEAMVKHRMEHTAPFEAVTASLLGLAHPKAGHASPDTI
ncbi:hypothetical protein V5O48_019415, partial [Marasmius crinis-equi]